MGKKLLLSVLILTAILIGLFIVYLRSTNFNPFINISQTVPNNVSDEIAINCIGKPYSGFINDSGEESRMVYSTYLLVSQGIAVGDPPEYRMPDDIEFYGFTVPDTDCYAVWFSKKGESVGTVVYESDKGIITKKQTKDEVLQNINSNTAPAYEETIQ